MSLIVDSASAVRRLGPEEFSRWAATRTVFLSSEMRDLDPLRVVVADVSIMKPKLPSTCGGSGSPRSPVRRPSSVWSSGHSPLKLASIDPPLPSAHVTSRAELDVMG